MYINKRIWIFNIIMGDNSQTKHHMLKVKTGSLYKLYHFKCSPIELRAPISTGYSQSYWLSTAHR